MHARFNKRLLLVWLVLASLTLAYLWIDGPNGVRASTLVTSTVIVIALVKVRIIFREFMEVREAPAVLGRLTDAWVLLIAAGLFGSYFVGLAVHH